MLLLILSLGILLVKGYIYFYMRAVVKKSTSFIYEYNNLVKWISLKRRYIYLVDSVIFLSRIPKCVFVICFIEAVLFNLCVCVIQDEELCTLPSLVVSDGGDRSMPRCSTLSRRTVT